MRNIEDKKPLDKRMLFGIALLITLIALLIYRFAGVSGAGGDDSDLSGGPDTDPVFISIVGDSISTYDGYLPTEPEAYQPWYPREGLHDVNDTWWARVIEENRLTLLINASWTGSHVTGDSEDKSGYSGCGDGRADAVRGYHNDGTILPPDMILVFMGANDFLHSVDPGEYTPGKKTVEGAQDNFADAYRMLLEQLTSRYDESGIICMTCLPCVFIDEGEEWVNGLGLTIEDYNDIIRDTAKEFDCPVIDTYECGIDSENADDLTEDGIHPNTEGAALIAGYVTDGLKEIGIP